jgi:hypothetical protein
MAIGSVGGLAQAYKPTLDRFDTADKARGDAVAAALDRYGDTVEQEPRARQDAPQSGTASVVVELSTIKRATISLFTALPTDVQITLSDTIRETARSGHWPKGLEQSDQAVRALILQHQ